jgi:hypothetical protein
LSKSKKIQKEIPIKINMTFEEAMKKALNTPPKKKKQSTNIKKSGK